MNSCQDRLLEFNQIVNSLKTNRPPTNNFRNNKSDNVKWRRQKLIEQSSQFTNIAKNITNQISITCTKLEKLNNLIRTSTLLKENTNEMQSISDLIKQDIKEMARNMKQLADLNASSQQSSSQSSRHKTSIVSKLQGQIVSMSTNFDNCLRNQLHTMRSHAKHKNQFANPSSAGPVKSLPAQPHIPSFLLEDESGRCDADNLTASAPQQLMTMQLADETQSYLSNRNESARQVEATIIEMGTMFQQLSCLVHEHGQQIERISTAVDSSALNIQAGHSELLKLYQSATNNRWLILKVFGVLAIFSIISVVLLA